MDKPKVLLSLPNMGSCHIANSAAVETMMLSDERVQLHVLRSSAIPVENNLNQVIKQFLAGDWDYWINLDEDQAPLQNPLDLVFLDKDVIGLPTPVFKHGPGDGGNPFYWNVYSWDEQEQVHRPHQAKKGRRRPAGGRCGRRWLLGGSQESAGICQTTHAASLR